MGGTTLAVLNPFTAERAEAVVVEEMIAEGLTRCAPDSEYWYSADGLPYGYSLDFPHEEFDLRAVERTAGTGMRSEILLHIFTSDIAGRPALGRMAQRVAERAGGWVFVEFRTPPSADLLHCLETAGRLIRVDGAVYLDGPAMAAWNAHPDFHVVK
ncbi:hypothetical protein [Actinokineospora fastidiosa]|uniref:hypothetical protein n=1 Tax=Actinokineospora fastidiosa TaxID=1816 RepID=UPI00166FED11|nr:hypothetical protein [Actinokineospora fastidiosa]